jgi:hypothetical protein
MAGNDARAKAFDFAQETTKQILTLAAGIITVTVTFIGSDLKAYPSSTRTWLELSWLFFLISILFGVFTLMSLSGTLERPGEARTPSIYAPGIRVFGVLEVGAFMLGLAFTALFGANAA